MAGKGNRRFRHAFVALFTADDIGKREKEQQS
jgi:hypothetical protein